MQNEKFESGGNLRYGVPCVILFTNTLIINQCLFNRLHGSIEVSFTCLSEYKLGYVLFKSNFATLVSQCNACYLRWSTNFIALYLTNDIMCCSLYPKIRYLNVAGNKYREIRFHDRI